MAVGEPKRWEDKIPEDDLFVEAPVAVLLHGTQEVTYEVYGFNGVVTHSSPLTLTIDTVPPVLGGDEGLLLFDEEVGREGVIEPAKVIVPVSANAVLLARPKAMARRVFFIF